MLTTIKTSQGNAAIVFVHGLMSDARNAWTNANGTFWPILLSNDKSVSKASVYTFGYQANATNRHFTVDEAAHLLYSVLSHEELLRREMLIFVCHSLGGFIVRQMILNRQLEFCNAKIGLVLVASPSLGSNYANLARILNWAIKNPQVRVLQFSDRNDSLNSLDSNFFNLVRGNLMNIKGLEILEADFLLPTTLTMRLLRLFFSIPIVRAMQGSRYFPNHVMVPYSDHLTVAKPSSNEAIQHRALVSFIAGFLRDSRKSSTTRDSRKSLTTQKEVFMTGNVRATKKALIPFEQHLKESPYVDIIGELNNERTLRSSGKAYNSPWDGDDLRDLPAFLEKAWQSLHLPGITLDLDAVSNSEVGQAVLLCDDSYILWKGEPIPKSDDYWHDFNLFADTLRKYQERR